MSIGIEQFQAFAARAIREGISEDAVVQLGADNSLGHVKWQTLGGRDKTYKDLNQATRRELIASLRDAFGGVSLDKLPDEFRKALKLDDFRIDKNGNVGSKRPLTVRRIIAISRAVEAWKARSADAVAAVAEKSGLKQMPGAMTVGDEVVDRRRDATERLVRLFDPTRPLPANLSQDVLETAGKLLVRANLKPFHMRLALTCYSKILEKGFNGLSGKTPEAQLENFSMAFGGIVREQFDGFLNRVEDYARSRGGNPKADPNPPDFIRDGASGAVDIADHDLIRDLIVQLAASEHPQIGQAIDRIAHGGPQNFLEKMGKLSAECNDLLTELDALRDADAPGDVIREKEKSLGELKAVRGLMYAFLDEISKRAVVAESINYAAEGVVQLDEEAYKGTVERFNGTDTKAFSAEAMFVTNGKTGINTFDPKLKRVFANVNRKGMGDQTQRIARSLTRLEVLEQMVLHVTDAPNNQFKKDWLRSNIMDETGRLLQIDGGLDKVNDIFAAHLLHKKGATYAQLSPQERCKVMLMKSLLNQNIEQIPGRSVNLALSPNGTDESSHAVEVRSRGIGSSTNLYRYSFDDDGGISVSLFRDRWNGVELACQTDQLQPVEDEDDEPSTEIRVDADDRDMRAVMRIDLHISPEEVNRIADLDWDKLDFEAVGANFDKMLADRPPHGFETFAETHIPQEFRFNIETSVSVKFMLEG